MSAGKLIPAPPSHVSHIPNPAGLPDEHGSVLRSHTRLDKGPRQVDGPTQA